MITQNGMLGGGVCGISRIHPPGTVNVKWQMKQTAFIPLRPEAAE